MIKNILGICVVAMLLVSPAIAEDGHEGHEHHTHHDHSGHDHSDHDG